MSGLRQIPHRTHGRLPAQEYRLRLKRPAPHFVGPLQHLNPRPRTRALAPPAFFRGAAALCFAHARKNMSQHIFRSSVELQNSREGGLRTLASFSVRERLARYGSSALSGVEHLRLLVGRDSAVDTLLRTSDR